MKEWLKKFVKGTYIACWMIIVAGLTFIVTWALLLVVTISSAWLATVTPPTTNNIIIMFCIFFVVVFGLVWSTWS